MNRKEIKEHHERMRILDVKIRAIKNAVNYETVKQFVKERPDLIDKIKENYIKKPGVNRAKLPSTMSRGRQVREQTETDHITNGFFFVRCP